MSPHHSEMGHRTLEDDDDDDDDDDSVKLTLIFRIFNMSHYDVS
jgi:hypothetical protein